MKVKDLPKAIKRRAMPYIKENFPNKKHRPKGIMEAFDWTLTEEGFDYWKLVNDGEFLKAEKFLKVREMNTDAVWTHWSLSTEDAPFFLDEALDVKVNEPEVVSYKDEMLVEEDYLKKIEFDWKPFTHKETESLGTNSVKIINDSFKKAIEMKRDRIVEGVIEKFRSRSEVGIKKYGTTLADNNTDDFLNHLQEELMDAILYIEKLKDR
jgi:hypothetical protein